MYESGKPRTSCRGAVTDAQNRLDDVVQAMNHEPPWDYGRARAALRVAIEAAANVAEERSENPHWAPECRKAALSIASRIRALLPPEETP